MHYLLLLTAITLCLGCRVSDPPVLKENKTSLFYDGFRQAEVTDSTPLLVRQAYDAQNHELSEPVAVVHWEPQKHSQWEVFFATNRGIDSQSPGQASYGNQVLTEPQYGRAVIQIPTHKRGEDPLLEAPTKKWGIIPVSKSPQATDIVKFPLIEPTTSQSFFEGINRQIAGSRDHDLLLFVHGFNVNFEAALLRTAQLGLDMPFNGALVGYVWPSQGGIRNYETDETINLASVVPFTDFLTRLIQAVPPGTRINIIVHSMGNRIVMQALSQLPLPPQNTKSFHHLALCAPDVGIADYQKWIPGCVSQCDHVTLYTNIGDSALISSKSLHVEQRAGDAHPPIVTDGVETIDCSSIELTIMGHSYYDSNADVLTDLFMLLKLNRRAGERTHLKMTTNPRGQSYYLFENHSPQLFYSWNFENN